MKAIAAKEIRVPSSGCLVSRAVNERFQIRNPKLEGEWKPSGLSVRQRNRLTLWLFLCNFIFTEAQIWFEAPAGYLIASGRISRKENSHAKRRQNRANGNGSDDGSRGRVLCRIGSVRIWWCFARTWSRRRFGLGAGTLGALRRRWRTRVAKLVLRDRPPGMDALRGIGPFLSRT